MYKEDLALNNPQGLICYKNQTKQIIKLPWGKSQCEFKSYCQRNDNLSVHLPKPSTMGRMQHKENFK